MVHGTDPRKADTDGGGANDGDEIRDGYDPLNPNDDGIEFLITLEPDYKTTKLLWRGLQDLWLMTNCYYNKPYANWFLLQARASSPYYHYEASNYWACYYHIEPASTGVMKNITVPLKSKNYVLYKSPRKNILSNAKNCKIKPYSIQYYFPKDVKLTTRHWIYAPAGIIDGQNRLISVTRKDINEHEKIRKDKGLWQRREKIRTQNKKLKLLKSFDAKLFKLETKEIPDNQTLRSRLNIPIKIDVYYRGK